VARLDRDDQVRLGEERRRHCPRARGQRSVDAAAAAAARARAGGGDGGKRAEGRFAEGGAVAEARLDCGRGGAGDVAVDALPGGGRVWEAKGGEVALEVGGEHEAALGRVVVGESAVILAFRHVEAVYSWNLAVPDVAIAPASYEGHVVGGVESKALLPT